MEWVNRPDKNNLIDGSLVGCPFFYCPKYLCDCFCPPPMMIMYP